MTKPYDYDDTDDDYDHKNNRYTVADTAPVACVPSSFFFFAFSILLLSLCIVLPSLF